MSRTLPPVASTRTGVGHAVAECIDCEWTNENRKNALATGNLHARRTGHEVHVEQVTIVIYNRNDARYV